MTDDQWKVYFSSNVVSLISRIENSIHFYYLFKRYSFPNPKTQTIVMKFADILPNDFCVINDQ